MTVIECKEDNRGNYPIWFKGGSLKGIHEWLFHHYNGYKFCIIFDETHDEFEEFDNPVPVYFLDDALDEALDYIGKELKKDVVDKRSN